MPFEGLEIGLEIRNRQMVGMLVIDAEPSAYVQVANRQPQPLQADGKIIDPVAKGHEIGHVQDLRSDVEMQAAVLHVRTSLGQPDHFRQCLMENTELVLRKASGDVGMGMGADVGIDPETDARNLAHFRSNLLNDKQFCR